MPDLLLLSNSRAPGMGFLEHATDAIKGVLGDRASVLFVPFAGSDPDAYTTTMRGALARIGVRVTGLHEVPDAVRAIGQAEAIFVGGGNSFRLLRSLNRLGVLAALREAAVTGGVPYLGASAGSNLACPTIRTTNDMPIVEVPSLSALGLIPFQLNPHYLDPDLGSTHQGETRQQRLEEFLDENDVPVRIDAIVVSTQHDERARPPASERPGLRDSRTCRRWRQPRWADQYHRRGGGD